MTSIAPSDGAVALRSLPRRFRELFTGFDDDEKPDDLLHRKGADGHSALDHAAHVPRALALIGEALRKTLTADEPVLHPGVLDEREREWPDGYAEGLDDVLGLLEEEASQLADLAQRTSADDWTRSATVAGGSRATALDLLQEAVRTGVDHLKDAERTLREVRGR
jgi:hypothetical protein